MVMTIEREQGGGFVIEVRPSVEEEKAVCFRPELDEWSVEVDGVAVDDVPSWEAAARDEVSAFVDQVKRSSP